MGLNQEILRLRLLSNYNVSNTLKENLMLTEQYKRYNIPMDYWEYQTNGSYYQPKKDGTYELVIAKPGSYAPPGSLVVSYFFDREYGGPGATWAPQNKDANVETKNMQDGNPNTWPKILKYRPFRSKTVNDYHLIADLSDSQKKEEEKEKQRKEDIKKTKELLKQVTTKQHPSNPEYRAYEFGNTPEQIVYNMLKADLAALENDGFPELYLPLYSDRPKPLKDVSPSIYKKPGTSSNFTPTWEYERGEKDGWQKYRFTDIKGGNEYNRYYELYERDLDLWLASNRLHKLLLVGSIAAFLVFPGTWVPLLVSTGIALADAQVYKSEGNNFMYGLSTVFALFPVVGKFFPKFFKLPPNLQNLVSKYISTGGKVKLVSQSEKEALYEIILNQTKLTVAQKAAQGLAKLLSSIQKSSTGQFLKGTANLIKQYPNFSNLIGTTLIYWKGIPYPYEKLYNIYMEKKQQKDLASVKSIDAVVNKIKGEIPKNATKLDENIMNSLSDENQNNKRQSYYETELASI